MGNRSKRTIARLRRGLPLDIEHSRRNFSLFIDLAVAFAELFAVLAFLLSLPPSWPVMWSALLVITLSGLCLFFNDALWLWLFGRTVGTFVAGYRLTSFGDRRLTFLQAVHWGWFRFCWFWLAGDVSPVIGGTLARPVRRTTRRWVRTTESVVNIDARITRARRAKSGYAKFSARELASWLVVAFGAAIVAASLFVASQQLDKCPADGCSDSRRSLIVSTKAGFVASAISTVAALSLGLIRQPGPEGFGRGQKADEAERDEEESIRRSYGA